MHPFLLLLLLSFSLYFWFLFWPLLCTHPTIYSSQFVFNCVKYLFLYFLGIYDGTTIVGLLLVLVAAADEDDATAEEKYGEACGYQSLWDRRMVRL